jgi:hypothetical protein
VTGFYDAQPLNALYICVVSIAEIRFGIELQQDVTRRAGLNVDEDLRFLLQATSTRVAEVRGVECCATCGEPLGEDGRCGVCLLVDGLDREELPATIGTCRIVRLLVKAAWACLHAEWRRRRRDEPVPYAMLRLLGDRQLRRRDRVPTKPQ